LAALKDNSAPDNSDSYLATAIAVDSATVDYYLFAGLSLPSPPLTLLLYIMDSSLIELTHHEIGTTPECSFYFGLAAARVAHRLCLIGVPWERDSHSWHS